MICGAIEISANKSICKTRKNSLNMPNWYQDRESTAPQMACTFRLGVEGSGSLMLRGKALRMTLRI